MENPKPTNDTLAKELHERGFDVYVIPDQNATVFVMVVSVDKIPKEWLQFIEKKLQ